MIIAALVTALLIPEARGLDFYVSKIEWGVVFFLVSMFTIVEVLNQNNVFDELARMIVVKYQNNLRKMLYVICIVSTLTASIVEDVSIAMIFIPIVIAATRRLNIRPAAYILGITVSINLAAALTPFGSAQNVLISNEFGLDTFWFITRLGPYFVLSLITTLILLDRFWLKKDLEYCSTHLCGPEKVDADQSLFHPLIEKKKLYINLAALIILIFLFVFMPELYLAGIIGALMFIFINPIKTKNDKKSISLTHYLSGVNYRIIYFFICLFIFVGLMELNGTIAVMERLILNLSAENEFALALIILFSTSILSGFLDNTPVTIMYIPIVRVLLKLPEYALGPLVVAFVLGINLGGNFLPQGSAADMMTLEISRESDVKDMSYKRLFKVGGFFALIHVLLGVGYLAFMIFFL
ncbi:MAG: SLC13 family permease [Promethearchaeia archaeon]